VSRPTGSTKLLETLRHLFWRRGLEFCGAKRVLPVESDRTSSKPAARAAYGTGGPREVCDEPESAVPAVSVGYRGRCVSPGGVFVGAGQTRLAVGGFLRRSGICSGAGVWSSAVQERVLPVESDRTSSKPAARAAYGDRLAEGGVRRAGVRRSGCIRGHCGRLATPGRARRGAEPAAADAHALITPMNIHNSDEAVKQ
jgi:hypothetical protein